MMDFNQVKHLVAPYDPGIDDLDDDVAIEVDELLGGYVWEGMGNYENEVFRSLVEVTYR